MHGAFLLAGLLAPAQYAMTWFAQSTALLACGLLAGRALRTTGPAVQSAIYRTTLAAVLVCPAASLGLAWAGVPGLLLRLPDWVKSATLDQNRAMRIAAIPGSLPSAATESVSGRTIHVTDRDGQQPRLQAPNVNSPATNLDVASTPAQAITPGPGITGAQTKAATNGLPNWQLVAGRSLVAGLIVWMLGASFLGLRLLVGHRGMARLRSEAALAEPEAQSLCHVLAQKMNLHAPEVLRSPFLASPCLEGIRRPGILLPEDAEENLRETFVHELAHLARHDGLWNLLRLGATALFWVQPLLWVLSRRLESTAEEVCDDHVVQFGADRARYAGHLLELAERRMLPLIPAGVGMVSLRSMLARRVTRILDSSRVLSTKASTRALTATLLIGLTGTVLAGLLGVGGAAPRASGDEPKARGTRTADVASRLENKRRTVHGKVLGPDGKPAANAVVTVARFRPGGLGEYEWDTDRQELDRAIADSDGRFSLTYPELDSETVEDPQSPDRWAGMLVVASARGTGSVWVGAGSVTEEQPLKLVPDDVPVTGKVVDLEGRAVSGATIRIESLWTAKSSEAIDQWLAEVKRGPAGGERPRSHYFPIASKLPKNEPPIATPVTTDAEGRFRLNGLGRDRMAVLDIRGASVAFRRVQVITRVMERVEGRHLDEPGLTDPSYYGANATIVVEPGRTIEGVVRDAKTKAPIPNATVTANQLANSLMSIEGLINAVTDGEGRYRLIGLPKGDGHKVGVHPPLDQPYFITERLPVTAGPGLGPVNFDIELRRGLWITGRITDAKTGKPVQSAIHYFPFLTNTNAVGFPNFEPGTLSLHWTGSSYRTDRDGRYRVVGLPGRGLVAAKSFDRSYRLGVGADTFPEKPSKLAGRTNGLPTYNEVDPNDYQTVAAVDPSNGSAEFARDLALEPSPSLSIELLDPEGNPLSGAVVWGRFPEPLDAGDHNLYDQTRTQIVGLDPAKPRTVVFEHRERKLGAIVVVKPGEEGQRRVTLQPCAVVTGRVVDADGRPVAGGVAVSLARASGERSREFQLTGVAFDANGRFRIDSLPAGGTYTFQAVDRLVYSIPMAPERFKAFEILRDFKPTSGQALELGTFSAATGKQIKAPENQAANLQGKRAELPITGRIIDLEGRGIGGVKVRADRAIKGAGDNLTAWLDAVRGGAARHIAANHLDYEAAAPVEEKVRETTTDAEGRFRLDGFTEERVVNLSIQGPTITRGSLTVVTRRTGPVPARGFPSLHASGTEIVYGADFTHTAIPGRPIEGMVRDAKTGTPLAGLDVYSYRYAGSDFIGIKDLKATTDAEGRFRLEGMPKGAGNSLLIVPTDDQPYFMREFPVPDPSGLATVTVEIGLHRGIWIEGKVTDKATGEPVPNARLHYLPFLSNTFAQATPEFDAEGNTDGVGHQTRYETKADGTFRLVGLPGRAIVGVVAHSKSYLQGYGASAIAGINAAGHFETWRNPINPGKFWPTAMKEVDPTEKVTTVRVNFELVSGASVRVRAVDVDGKPVTGVTVGGRTGRGDRESESMQDAEFAIENLAPDEERVVMIRHAGRRVGKVLKVRVGDASAGPIVVTLEPFAVLSGRVMDSEGASVSGASVRSDLLPSGDFSLNLGQVGTDSDGRFRVADVPTGCDYSLVIEHGAANRDRRVAFYETAHVRPRETTDVGEIRFKKD